MCLVNLQCLCCVISLFCVPDGADQPQGKFLCVEELPVFVFPCCYPVEIQGCRALIERFLLPVVPLFAIE